MKKILITGAGGMLAQDADRAFQGCYQVITMGEHDLDICHADKVHETIKNLSPDVVLNCAAYTRVDDCETEQEKAFAVNAEGVKNIALACRDRGSLLVHISTDYVFDGTKREPYREADETNPLSVYGQTKLAGENFVRAILSRYVLIRSLWLYGRGGNNFVATIQKLALEKKELSVVNDQTGAPTYTRDLAHAIKTLIGGAPQGIYNISNQGTCTWYEFACRIVELTNSATRVIPISSDEINRPAKRPAYSVLDCSRFIQETGMELRHWDAALQEYLKGKD
jgi:dTDP-4-dehydrorhamnose reductase